MIGCFVRAARAATPRHLQVNRGQSNQESKMMSDQEPSAVPSREDYPEKHPVGRLRLPPLLTAAAILLGALFGLAAVVMVWLLARVLPW